MSQRGDRFRFGRPGSNASGSDDEDSESGASSPTQPTESTGGDGGGVDGRSTSDTSPPPTPSNTPRGVAEPRGGGGAPSDREVNGTDGNGSGGSGGGVSGASRGGGSGTGGRSSPASPTEPPRGVAEPAGGGAAPSDGRADNRRNGGGGSASPSRPSGDPQRDAAEAPSGQSAPSGGDGRGRSSRGSRTSSTADSAGSRSSTDSGDANVISESAIYSEDPRIAEQAQNLQERATKQLGFESKAAVDVSLISKDGERRLKAELTDYGRERQRERAADSIERQLESTRAERAAQQARESGATAAQAESVQDSISYATGAESTLDVSLGEEDIGRETRVADPADALRGAVADGTSDLALPGDGEGPVTQQVRTLNESGEAKVQEARLDQATQLIDEQVPTDVNEGDVTRTEQGGYTLSQQGRRELEQFQERRQAGIQAGRERVRDSVLAERQQSRETTETSDGINNGRRPDLYNTGESPATRGLPDEVSGDEGVGAVRRETSGQETRAPPSAGVNFGTLQEPGIGSGAASTVAPHAAMGLDEAGLAARREREEIFAERAEQGFEDITSGQLPSLDEVGAMYFQGVEVAERSIMDAGQEFSDPIRGAGPTLPGGNTVGDVGANLVDFTVGGVAAGVGAAQFPVTATADTQFPGVMERDATVSRRQLSQPRIATPELGPGERPSTDAFAQDVAALNPNLDADDVSVSRDGDQYRVQTDLAASEQRNRIAAANEGVGASDVTFVGEGEQARAVAFERDADGQTPSEVTGTVGQFERAVETQVTAAEEAPYATGILLGLPAAEAVPAGVRGYRATRGTSATVDYRAITSERGASGETPSFRTSPGESTGRAVRELEARARQQPEAVQEALGTEQVLYHTTPERLGSELTVAEGGSELPGLFVSPDANPIGLSRVAGGERASLLDRVRPTRPDLSLQPDRVAAFQGDRIAAMPESARGVGYEVRNPSGRPVERGLGRGQAKARAEGADLSVRPQSDLPGYRFLTEQAEPGTAYAKPRASRSTELEGIFPPESRFQRGGKVSVELPSGERVPADIFRRTPEQPARSAAGRTASTSQTATGGEIARSYTTRPTGRQGFTAATYATATSALSETASGRTGRRPTDTDSSRSRTTEDVSRLPERLRSGRESPTSGRSEVSRPPESVVPSEGVSYGTSDPSRYVSEVPSFRGSSSTSKGRSRPSRAPESPLFNYPTSPTESALTETSTTPTTGTPTTGITGDRRIGTPFDPPESRRRRRPDSDQDREPPEFIGGRTDPYDVPFQNPIATGGQVLFGSVGGFGGRRAPPEASAGGPVDETGLKQLRDQSLF